MDSMAKKIKQLREANNMTLEQVGDIVGVGKSTVRKWETGLIANMRRDKIAKLAEALHTTPAYLMGWEENKGSDGEGALSENTDPYKAKLDECYNMLNNYGKREACQRVSELTEISRYTVDDEDYMQMPQIVDSEENLEVESKQAPKISEEERQKQLAQFLKDRREGKIRFTSYAAYGGDGVKVKRTTKEESEALAEAVRKIKEARKHKNPGDDKP